MQARNEKKSPIWCSFTWNSEQYRHHSTPQQMRAHMAIENMGGLKPGMDVLDIGGGDGKIDAFIANKVFPGQVVYLDLSESMAVKAYSEHSNCKNLSVIQNNAAAFKLRRKFDCVTSFFCLQWVPGHLRPKVFENIYEHLNDDGKICILLPCLDFPHQVIKGVAFSEKWRSHFTAYNEPQTFDNESYYQQLLQEKGFTNIQTIMMESHHELTNEEFIKYTRQWCGCYLCLQDEKLQNEFIRDIHQRLEEEKHENGKFDMKQMSIQIIAQKPRLELSLNMKKI